MSETISFKVTHGKIQYSISLPIQSTVKDLKNYLEQQTRVPANLQKLFLKGPLKNNDTILSSLNLRETTKILLVGSTADEISITSNIRTSIEEERKIDIPRDAFPPDQQRIIDKGPPADAFPGDLFSNINVPDTVPGLYNHAGANARLTVKKEIDEVWIVNNTSTKRIPFAAIGNINYIPILKYPGYTILTLVLGPSNKYNLYFFPQQFFNTLKTLICPLFIDGLDLSQFK
ncbi:hypothetical protein SteCoe_10192 [Stentor coeruleus]|uniref:Ubiquitin-like domain-containing protein n=1 Tax=Stentor coeruleus TaxID=5963 RepID=A0A1R2CG05_9CILI|nr:hypothetical protein SteCoe_10192 [Stentor coeruleus]